MKVSDDGAKQVLNCLFGLYNNGLGVIKIMTFTKLVLLLSSIERRTKAQSVGPWQFNTMNLSILNLSAGYP
jgi:hypothetical protein